MTIIRPTTINTRFSKPVGLGGEKLWLCPTLGGDRLDISGNGNHGAYNGGMGTVVDKYKGNRAFDLDGVDDYIDISGFAVATSSYSVSLWLNGTGPNQTIVAFNTGNSTGQRASNIGLQPAGTVLAGHQFGGTSYWADSTSTVNGSGWKHVLYTYDGTTVEIFVDGVSEDTQAAPNSNVSQTLGYIGRWVGSTPFWMTGYIDDIRAYNRVLTQAEINHLASYRGVLGSPRQPYDPLKRTVVRVPAAIPTATKVGSFKKPKTIIKPSYQAGYARNASESENPKLWDGLVGAWMPSLGVTGETLRDVSGNGNHGTLTNMDAASDWVATSKGLALDFDGGNDYVSVGNKPSLQITKQITLSAWVRGVPQSNKGIVGKYDSSVGQRGYLIAAQQASPSNRITWYYQRFAGSFTSDFITSSSVVLDGDWHFIACSFVSSVYARIYVDGVLDVSSTTNIASGIANNSASFSIGTHARPAKYFNGNVSSVSVHNRALSPSEIKQLYVDSLAPFRKKQRVSVAVPGAVTPTTAYHPLRSLAHPLEQ